MSPVNNEFKMASGKCAFLDLAACCIYRFSHFVFLHEVSKIQKMSKIPTLGLPPPQALVVSWEGHDFERPCGIL
jgi:hypothetical protein